MTEHGDTDDLQTVCLRLLYRGNQIFSVKHWCRLDEKVDNAQSNAGAHRAIFGGAGYGGLGVITHRQNPTCEVRRGYSGQLSHLAQSHITRCRHDERSVRRARLAHSPTRNKKPKRVSGHLAIKQKFADHLVHRVMAPNILTNEKNISLAVKSRSGMHSPCQRK